jgi:hypothetical protein
MFRREILPRGIEAVLREVSGLDAAAGIDRTVMETVLSPPSGGRPVK